MRWVGAVLVALLVSACTAGPDYHRPPVLVPQAFKEAPAPDPGAPGWKPAQPRDAAPRGAWWEVFGDAALSSLEAQVAGANPTVAVAEAHLRAARAAIRVARADKWPTVTGSVSVTEAHGSANRGAGRVGVGGTTSGTASDFTLPIDAAYEVDLWGRVRRNVEASVASAQATAADLATARLSLEAEAAADYFQLQGLDLQHALLVRTADGYEKALRLTTARHDQGVSSGIDVAQAEAQLATTRAQAIDLDLARAQVEHAIAVLVGRPPASFSLPASSAASASQAPPPVPDAVPSELLERRPDIAAAERRVAASNALVGVATSAFFPSLVLSAAGGLESSSLANWFTLPSRFWSIGPSMAASIFDGGRRKALVEQARANYDATVASYRQEVLSAFQDVEDNLAAIHVLGQEAVQQEEATRAAERALALAIERYQGGITTYLEVITAQTIALASERTSVELQTRRMLASVQLTKALGGGWRASDLATALQAAPEQR